MESPSNQPKKKNKKRRPRNSEPKKTVRSQLGITFKAMPPKEEYPRETPKKMKKEAPSPQKQDKHPKPAGPRGRRDLGPRAEELVGALGVEDLDGLGHRLLRGLQGFGWVKGGRVGDFGVSFWLTLKGSQKEFWGGEVLLYIYIHIYFPFCLGGGGIYYGGGFPTVMGHIYH